MKLSKNFFAVILFAASVFGVKAQAVNSSYVTEFGEKALQFSIIVPGERAEVWKLFTTDQGLKKWIAPVVKTNIKTGGWIKTNYDKSKTADDETAIRLDIINYLDYQMLTLKVNLNDHFPAEAQNEDQNLQEIIQFVEIEKGKTKIISTMVGWGQGSHWDKTYTFFEKGNEWTYNELLKLVDDPKK